MTIGHRHAVPGPDEHGHVRRHVPECDRALCSAAKAGSDLGEPCRLRDPSRHELDEITASVDRLEEAVPRATYCGGKFVDRQSIMIEERLHDGLGPQVVLARRMKRYELPWPWHRCRTVEAAGYARPGDRDMDRADCHRQ